MNKYIVTLSLIFIAVTFQNCGKVTFSDTPVPAESLTNTVNLVPDNSNELNEQTECLNTEVNRPTKVLLYVDISSSNIIDHTHDFTDIEVPASDPTREWRYSLMEAIGNLQLNSANLLQIRANAFYGQLANLTNAKSFVSTSNDYNAAFDKFKMLNDSNSGTNFSNIFNDSKNIIINDLLIDKTSKYLVYIISDGGATDYNDLNKYNIFSFFPEKALKAKDDKDIEFAQSTEEIVKLAPDRIEVGTILYSADPNSATQHAVKTMKMIAEAGGGKYLLANSKAIPFDIEQLSIPCK